MMRDAKVDEKDVKEPRETHQGDYHSILLSTLLVSQLFTIERTI
jgi:hypothetical protein